MFKQHCISLRSIEEVAINKLSEKFGSSRSEIIRRLIMKEFEKEFPGMQITVVRTPLFTSPDNGKVGNDI